MPRGVLAALKLVRTHHCIGKTNGGIRGIVGHDFPQRHDARSRRWSEGVAVCRMFYGTPSQFLWEDEFGIVNHIPQGEGGRTR